MQKDRADDIVQGEVEHFSLQSIELNMENELMGLYQSLEGLLPATPRKVILFLGSRPEEGTSTIAREFAVVCAHDFKKSVLLLDAGLGEKNQHPIFNIQTFRCLEDVLAEPTPIDSALYQVGYSSLFLSKLQRGGKPNPQFLMAPAINNLFTGLSKNFDFVVIDSPPASTNFAISLAATKAVHGVILVMEAEKTRWPVVDNARSRIIGNGGKLLGIVLNKRRYHIPDFIYKRL